MEHVYSVNDILIRLTDERWHHIVENHNDLAGYYDDVLSAIETPDVVVRGYGGAYIAHKGFGKNRYLAVVYKELGSDDGFVISAYFTSKINRKYIVWPEQG